MTPRISNAGSWQLSILMIRRVGNSPSLIWESSQKEIVPRDSPHQQYGTLGSQYFPTLIQRIDDSLYQGCAETPTPHTNDTGSRIDSSSSSLFSFLHFRYSRISFNNRHKESFLKIIQQATPGIKDTQTQSRVHKAKIEMALTVV